MAGQANADCPMGPTSGPPTISTLWLVTSNLAYLAPVVLAWRADLRLRAFVFFTTMVVSGIYHYAHETEYQCHGYYNGFTLKATWTLTQADAVVSVWAACAGATLLVPMRSRASGFANIDTRSDLWADNAIVLIGGLASSALIWLGGYNYCEPGQFNCISDWMPLYFALVVIGCVVLEVAWVRITGHTLTHELSARTQHWGGRYVGLWAVALFVVTCIAAATYILDAPRPWHGAWHMSSAAALSLLVRWTTPRKADSPKGSDDGWTPLVQLEAGELTPSSGVGVDTCAQT